MKKANLEQFIKTVNPPLNPATLCFLTKNSQILLAMKKRGFAVGKWNGVGGKVDKKDQSIRHAAIRETREEIGVIPKKLTHVATLSFYHLHNHNQTGMRVSVFLCNAWKGQPVETEEMAPQWFDLGKIPYHKMWEDDSIWLPEILSGKKITGNFLFDNNQNLIEYTLLPKLKTLA